MHSKEILDYFPLPQSLSTAKTSIASELLDTDELLPDVLSLSCHGNLPLGGKAFFVTSNSAYSRF